MQVDALSNVLLNERWSLQVEIIENIENGLEMDSTIDMKVSSLEMVERFSSNSTSFVSKFLEFGARETGSSRHPRRDDPRAIYKKELPRGGGRGGDKTTSAREERATVFGVRWSSGP